MRVDDLPLRGVGILRFIHQHMIEAAIELVADPFRQFGPAEQSGGAADLVVEINEPGAGLGLVPAQRKGAAQLQRGGQPADQLQLGAQFAQGQQRLLHAAHRIDEIFLELFDIAAVADFIVLGG